MDIRTGLYIRSGEEPAHGDLAPVRVHMRPDLKCMGGLARAMELTSGQVVCASCQHGPCEVPAGIDHGRELRIIKDER